MKVVIHQPQYFPYPGFFHKLIMADALVILDNTQYDKRFTNRNKIWTPHGFTWLTVPIKKEHKFLPNKNVEINNDINWREEHWKKIFHSYSKAKYFPKYKEYFEKIYKKEWKYLCQLNVETLEKIIDFLGIKIKIIKETELNIEGTSTQRLVNCCQAIGADTYISGRGLPNKKYIDEKLFLKNNVKLIYQDYEPMTYQQIVSNHFESDLSIIDMLFNIGPESLTLITKSSKIHNIEK